MSKKKQRQRNNQPQQKRAKPLRTCGCGYAGKSLKTCQGGCGKFVCHNCRATCDGCHW
jgi:hypothetical protein